MPAARKGTLSVEDRVRAELQLIRANVVGVHGSLAATSDGFLLAHDVPDLEPTQIAALVATTHALASRTTLATGRGQFREAVVRGSLGYLAVYAAGRSAIVAVIGTNRLNVGMLQYQARDIIKRIAECSADIRKWAAAAGGEAGASSSAGAAASPSAGAAASPSAPAAAGPGPAPGGKLGGNRAEGRPEVSRVLPKRRTGAQ